MDACRGHILESTKGIEIKLGTCIVAYRLVQYGKVIWALVQIYFGIVQSTV